MQNQSQSEMMTFFFKTQNNCKQKTMWGSKNHASGKIMIQEEGLKQGQAFLLIVRILEKLSAEEM